MTSTSTTPGLPPVPGPVAAHEREEELDVLRGFALFGVFLVNAAVSARPLEAALEPPLDGAALGDWVAWGLLNGFGLMKFVALFSLLFGVGLVLQTERAEGKGGPRIYPRRLALLGVMGLAHGFLLFEGDILFPYALCGAVLYLCRGWSARRLARVALIPLGIGLLLSLGLALLSSAPGSEGELMATGGLGEDAERVHAAHRVGPLGLTLAYRAESYVGWLVLSSLLSFNWRVLALFFLGAAARKQGLFARDRAGLHRGLAFVALPLGALAEVGLLVVKARPGDPSQLEAMGIAAVGEVASLVLSAGYVGIVLWTVHGGLARGLQRALAAVGRTALTNYLLQSVLMNLLFYWFGLGLWNELAPLTVLGIVAVLFALQTGASVLWMRTFAIGPAEWLWRSLTYGRRVRWKRVARPS